MNKELMNHVHTSVSQTPSWLRPVVRWAGVIGLVAAGAVGMTGCVAEVSPAVDAPVGYAEYPSTYYDGHVVYYVEGRWYYPQGNRWYYYNRVPPALARQRYNGHRHAQPVYRRPGNAEPRHEHAPYGRGGGPPPVYQAPPAYRH